MQTKLEKLLQEPQNKRRLKLLAYGFLTLASLLFSILCFLSIVGLPLGILTLGLLTSNLIGTIISFIGLTSLGVGSGTLGLWLGWKTYKHVQINLKVSVIIEEKNFMHPRIEKEIAEIKKLRDSLAAPSPIDKSTLQQAYREQLSDRLVTQLLKIAKERGNQIANDQFLGEEINTDLTADMFKPLCLELASYNQELVQLSAIPTPAVFYLTATHIPQLTHKFWNMDVLPIILSNSGFKVIDLTGLAIEQSHLHIINKLIIAFEKNSELALHIQLSLILLQSQEPTHQKLVRRTQQLNYAQAFKAANFISYLQQQTDGLLSLQNEALEHVVNPIKGMQYNLSNMIEAFILPFIPDDYHASQLMKWAAHFDKAMTEYNQNVFNRISDVVFYLGDIKKYTAEPSLEKLCAHLKAWGFKTFSLSEVEEPKTKIEQEEIERAISNLIQYFIDNPKITLKLELPKWFADKSEHEAQVLMVQEVNVNLEVQDKKNLALVVHLEEKKKPSVEENSSFSFFKKAFTKIINKRSYKEEKLLEARTNLLMLLGLVYATDKEERMQQVADFKQSDVEKYFRNLSLIVHPDKNNTFKSEQETDKSRADRCAQLFGDAAPRVEQRIECYVQYFGDQAFHQIKQYKELCVKTYKSEEVTLTEVDDIVEQSEQLCEDYVTRANMEREKAEARAKELHKRRKEAEARLEEARKATEKERTEKEKAKTETQEANKRAEDERTEKEIAKAEARAEKEKLQAENAALKKEMAIGKFHMALPNFDINLKRITADGNCQFSATQEAYLLINNNLDGDNAATLRAKVVAYIREHSERFRSFLAQETQAGHEHQDIAYSSIEEYVNNLEKTGTYGDHLSLQALAEIMQRPILVLQPSGNALKPVQVKVIRVEENKKIDINQALILIFNGRDHYESTKTRGNAEFMRLVYEALPEYHLAATKVQTFFKDYQMRKNRKNEAEATNKTIDVSTLKAEFN